MRKIVFFILSLWMFSINSFGQGTDSLQVGTDSLMTSQDYSTLPADINIVKLEADSAYMKGNYNSAIDIYEALLTQGEAAEVYYNLGNSYFKADNIAKAILNYERALLFEPGNSDVRANLEIAYSKTIDKLDSAPELFLISWINNLINCMSERAWAIFAIAFFILFIAAFYFFIFSKHVLVKKIGFFSALICFLLVVLANVFAARQKDKLTNRNMAIIMNPSVIVYSTPSDGGTNLFVLHEGSKVSVKDDSMKGWKEIQLEDGKVGWVPAEAIEVI